MHGFVIIVVSALALPGFTSGSKIEYLKVCKRNDPDLNECVRGRANAIIPNLARGVPEYDLPEMDPLKTKEMKIEENTQYVQIKLIYTDLTQVGLSQMQVDEVKMDLANGKMVFTLYQPFFSLTGQYKTEGTILSLPINGDGDFNSTHYETKIVATITFEIAKKGGEDFIDLKKLELDYTFGHAQIEYQNLFNGDKEMGDSTNKFLNENSHEILTDLKPALQQIYADMFFGYLKNFFDAVSFARLFPES